MSDLKREAVWRWLAVKLAAMSRGERPAKLVEVCLESSWTGQGSSR
jgi:hypothetical protein